MRTLNAVPLTHEAFAPYGDLLGGELANGVLINGGTSERLPLADPDLAQGGGHATLNLYRATARPLPFVAIELERHRLGSQSFIPLAGVPFVVIVALGDPAQDDGAPREDTVAAFWVSGSCGVTFRPGTWHHPLLAQRQGDFVVLERKGEGADCEVYTLNTPLKVILA